MYRNSAIVDSSGKWASAEEILTSPRNQVLSRPTSSFLSDWGVDASAAGKQAENASARRRKEQPPLSYHPSASSASALSYLTSQHGLSPLSPTRPEGRIPLFPVRRSVQPEQVPRHPESGESMVQNRSLIHKRSSSAPASDRIEFPNPQLANPYTQPSQDEYRATSIPAPRIEPPFASSAPQILMPRRFLTPSTQIPHEGPSKHIADNIYSPPHLQGPPTNSSRAARTDAFVAIDPFRPQIRSKYEKDPSTFDDIPIPEQQRQQSSIRPYLEVGVVVESPGPQITELMPIDQDRIRPHELVRQPSSDGHGFAANEDVKNAKERLLAEGQVQDQQKRLAPIRRGSDMGHKPHEGSLENYAAYPWKPPLPSSHSPSQSFSYGLNANAAMEKPNNSFWTNLSGYFVSPFNSRSKKSRGRYSFSSPYTHPPSTSSVSSSRARKPGTIRHISNFMLKILPAQIYLLVLLRVPSFYFSRVARIFEEADMTLSEIKKMALEMIAIERGFGLEDDKFRESGMQDPEKGVLPRYRRLKLAWEGFVDEVVSEWKMFNVISVLLLFVILITIQIESTSATADPVVRYTALCSLICALMSLAFGCVYVLRFGTMRKIWKAAEWALEAKKTKVFVWWNVWVMLAMPVVWLAWSILLYITSIMTFVWRTSSQTPGSLSTHGISHAALLAVRIVISVILGLGVVYMLSTMYTLGKYGDEMDRSWRKRAGGWIRGQEEERSRALNEYHKTWRPSQSTALVAPVEQLTAYGVDERRNDVHNGFADPMVRTAAKVVAITPTSPNYGLPLPSAPNHLHLDTDKSGLGLRQEKGKANGAVDLSSSAVVSPGSTLTHAQYANVAPTVLKPNFSKDLKTSEFEPISPQNPEPEDSNPGNSNANASARRRAKTASLAIPPPPSLPPIPGTPMSGLSGPRSRSVKTNTTFTTTSSVAAADRSFRHYSGFNLDSGRDVHADVDVDVRTGQRRVLSPMASVSAIGSEYLGSELSNAESEMVSEGSKSLSVPWTPLPSPATASSR